MNPTAFKTGVSVGLAAIALLAGYQISTADATVSIQLAQSTTNQPQRGTLEVVAELPLRPWNHAVTRDGRIFATVVRSTREQPALIEITGRNQYKPFPNAAWNATFGSSPDVLNCPHGVRLDDQNRLWVIDRGAWAILPDNGRSPLPDQQPKLLAFDINTGNLVYRLDLSEAVAPKSKTLVQDLAIDDRNGFVYIADPGIAVPPAIIVVDLQRKTARRFEAHPSLKAEDVDLVVEGKVIGRTVNGKFTPNRIGINPISLSADRETLFYGAMTGTSLWSVPTQLLREGANDQTIAAAIKQVGSKPVSDGMSTDTEGNHFITNVGDNAIDVLTSAGKLSRLVQDERLIWADSVGFGEPTWLYISVNQLNRSLLLNPSRDEGKPPYLILRVWTGTQGQPGR
jgi:sugar lactone lactonase YvrE